MELGQSFCFDDVLMEPVFSTINSRKSINIQSNIGTNGRNLILKTPLISSPMDTVTETNMAIQMALNGGLGIIHRYMTIEDQVLQVSKVKRHLQYIIQEPYTIHPDATYEDIEKLQNKYNVTSFCVVDDNKNFIGIITHRDIQLMNHKIKQQKQLQIQKANFSDCTCSTNNCSNSIYKVSDFMTKNVIKLEIKDNDYKMENVLKISKELMLKNKVEKIPILRNNSLIGLITLKNILYYEQNQNVACIDSNGALCVGAAIGITDDYITRLDALVVAGVDLVCIDVANGFNTNVFKAVADIRSRYNKLVLMVGNVCNWRGYAALSDYDVDCIRVGVGNGSICTTRLETGIGKGQFSAVSECFSYKCHNNKASHIICDGGSLGKTGNKVKAIASGASAIILGRTLASTEESPGSIIYRNGKRFKYIRGMASMMANLSKQEKISMSSTDKEYKTGDKRKNMHSEGVDGEQELSGSVVDVIEQINGGIKSGLSYLGCYNIDEVHSKNMKKEIKFNLISSIGMSENGIRVKTY
jgi:IMP dehydrogenase